MNWEGFLRSPKSWGNPELATFLQLPYKTKSLLNLFNEFKIPRSIFRIPRHKLCEHVQFLKPEKLQWSATCAFFNWTIRITLACGWQEANVGAQPFDKGGQKKEKKWWPWSTFQRSQKLTHSNEHSIFFVVFFCFVFQDKNNLNKWTYRSDEALKFTVTDDRYCTEFCFSTVVHLH